MRFHAEPHFLYPTGIANQIEKGRFSMAKRSKAKLIIELSAKNMSRREIARTRHISAHTIKEVLDRASEKDVGRDDVSLMGDDEVAAMLFPEDKEAEEAVARPDYGYVHDELRKVGVTLKLLWEGYRDECAENEKAAVSYVTFTRGYTDYAISKNVTNHLKYKPGQAMEVDWSGSTMRLVDPVTGAARRTSPSLWAPLARRWGGGAESVGILMQVMLTGY